MGFVERELHELGRALTVGEGDPRYPALFAAQLALSWALDPERFTPPTSYFRADTPAETKGYSRAGCQEVCSDTSSQTSHAA